MNKILTGATGYLGSYIAAELEKKQSHSTIVERNTKKIPVKSRYIQSIVPEATKPELQQGTSCDVDIVFSTAGKNRQKDRLTCPDVDYLPDINLLYEAKKAGVKKFINVFSMDMSALKYSQHTLSEFFNNQKSNL